MIINNFIGTLCENPREFKEVAGEKFYQADICLCDRLIPIVFSEFLLSEAKDRVQVTGYIKSEDVNGKLFTYIYANDIKPSTEDEGKDSAYINIEGTIVSVKDMIVLTNGKEVVPFIVGYHDNEGNYTVVHLVAYGKFAREVRAKQGQLDTKPTINCRGYISKRKPGITVSVISGKMV